jgi:hypothetical protein
MDQNIKYGRQDIIKLVFSQNYWLTEHKYSDIIHAFLE